MRSWKLSNGRSAPVRGTSGIPVTHRMRPRIRPRRSSHIIDKLPVGLSGVITAAHHIVKSVVERIGVSQPGIKGMGARSQQVLTLTGIVHRRAGGASRCG